MPRSPFAALLAALPLLFAAAPASAGSWGIELDNDRDPPPLNWSTFELMGRREDRYGEEKLQARRDRREAASG
jgi:hypothetical protein